jgi:hypothetical protein
MKHLGAKVFFDPQEELFATEAAQAGDVNVACRILDLSQAARSSCERNKPEPARWMVSVLERGLCVTIVRGEGYGRVKRP